GAALESSALVRALGNERGDRLRSRAVEGSSVADKQDGGGRGLYHPDGMAKYDPLRDFLNGLPKGQKQVTLGFKRVEELLGEALPASAREYDQWWRGGRVKRGRIDANWQDQVQQRAWEDIGWTVEELELLLKNVTFRRK